MPDALLIVNLAAALVVAAFILTYAGRPWYRSRYGVSIMSMKAAVLAVAVGGLARHLGWQGASDAALTVAWALLTVVMAWRLHMLWTDRDPTDKTD